MCKIKSKVKLYIPYILYIHTRRYLLIINQLKIFYRLRNDIQNKNKKQKYCVFILKRVIIIRESSDFVVVFLLNYIFTKCMFPFILCVSTDSMHMSVCGLYISSLCQFYWSLSYYRFVNIDNIYLALFIG